MATASRRYETRTVSELAAIDASWLAALIDGEGHIKIETLHRTHGDYRYVRLVVVNTCRELLEHAEAITNTGRIVARTGLADHWTQSYNWQACGRRATEVLEQVLPYLIAKREVAIDAIAWLEGGVLS